MTTAQETFSGTAPVQERHRFDNDALAAYLEKHIDGFKGPLAIEQFKGGQSNPTFRLSANGQRYVMRAKPAPVAKLLPSAHAIEREYRIMGALAQVGIPVPRMLCLCEDESVIGRAFMVMECVEGRIFWQQDLPGMMPPERGAIYDAMNSVLAALHSADHKAIGLEDYGRPGNYFGRQIARWSRQYRATETEVLPAMDNLIAWLPENIPPGDETSVVHGDYRMDNMIFHPTEPRVLALLDWELSTLGHPLADLSYQCMSWHVPPLAFRGIKGLDLAALGIPTQAEYVAAYCKSTGREAIANWNFYLAYNMFRLAAILQGVKKRALEGTASNTQAASAGERAKPLGEWAWGFAQKVIAGER